MNPIVKANSFNIAMENAFAPASGLLYSNAAGMRKNCGGRPKRIFYRAGNPGKRDYQVAMDSYLRCVDEVRKMNVAQGLPVETGLMTPSPSDTMPSSSLPKVPDTSVPDESSQKTEMSTTKKIMIGGGILVGAVALFFGIRHLAKNAKSGVSKPSPVTE